MQKTQKISTTQLAIVISSTIFGPYVLSFPQIIAKAADNAAPLMTIAGTCCAIFSMFVFTRISQRFSDKTLFSYSQIVIGRLPALVANLLVFACFFITSAMMFRQFGEVLSTVVFRRTPIEISILMILILVALSCRRDTVKFTYVHLFYWPFVILPFLFVIMMSMKAVHFLNWLPPFGNETPHWLPALLSPASLYLGSFIITILLPITEKPARAMKAALFGIVVSASLYLLLVLSTIGIYGVRETLQLLYPTLEMARSIAIGGDVIERMDALFIIMWVINVYTTMFSTYFLTSLSLSHLLQFKDHRLVTTLLIPFMFGVSLLPQDQYQLYKFSRIADGSGYLFLTGYALLLWIVAVVRRKGVRPHG
ncbi:MULTISPECIES: GerAB/ArcD/ProY family transporter [Paenibacillus]|jgi:spore germination protein|uniref:GerAB/ArcD/ProY family transporter n=1 Tax=Paenibacillus TaxID=44249 RepID=UPI00073F7EF2|nr:MULTISPECIES: endospore germination permease [Paenibacillus]MDU4695859.1 endospore germination permease [Paenibacillus sp.]